MYLSSCHGLGQIRHRRGPFYSAKRCIVGYGRRRAIPDYVVYVAIVSEQSGLSVFEIHNSGEARLVYAEEV